LEQRSIMKTLFYNDFENRLRAGWRIVIFSCVLMAGIALFSTVTGGSFGFALFMALFVLLLIWFASARLDKRPVQEYGIKKSKKWFRDFAAGNLMAAVSMSCIVIISLGMGWLKIEEFNYNLLDMQLLGGLLFTLIVMTAVSIWEEIYFRSFLITNLKEGLHFRIWGKTGAVMLAVVISSGIFGLMHFWNPNANLASTLNISIAGMVFAYPYIITNSIAIPIGMHLSWNYFQGAVFGLPVSGNLFDQMLMVVDVTGPEAFTGGSFGPEAGAAGLLGLMILLTCNEIYLSRFYRNKPHTRRI
jgi:uncharacterized protein